jgi:hypothetical protein
MSNIAKTIEYLKVSPTSRFIRLIKSATNEKLGKTDIYLDDITGEDLTAYIKNALGPITQTTLVYVEVRTKEGANSRKKDGYSLEIEPEMMQPQLPAVQVPAATPAPVVNKSTFEPASFLGQPVGLGQVAVGLGQMMEMHHNTSRLKDKEEALAELKEDYKELKQDFRLQEIENRELKTKLSTAEAQKELAVLAVKAENKSFFDSPAFEKVMEQAPGMLSAIAAMKGGAVTAGALGTPNLSETHNSLIDFIASNLDESQANYIGSICGLMSNPGFVAELNALITRYATN